MSQAWWMLTGLLFVAALILSLVALLYHWANNALLDFYRAWYRYTHILSDDADAGLDEVDELRAARMAMLDAEQKVLAIVTVERRGNT